LLSGEKVVQLKEQVEERLRSKGVKPTMQRTEIGMLMFASPRHMSADQIISDLRLTGSRVSKATVYNTLNLFSKHGLVREVLVDPERQFYDSKNGPHHHFYNVDTGELIDIALDDLLISRMPELPEDTEANDIEIVVKVRKKT